MRPRHVAEHGPRTRGPRPEKREAAVLVLLYPWEDHLATLLTVRPSTLRDHAGQVSFPGGRREVGETLEETALRECEEEVGISRADLSILGTLSPLYIPPTRFDVLPVVAAMPQRPVYTLDTREVAQVLEVPVPHLLQPETRKIDTWNVRGTPRIIPYFDVEGYRVWGATAAMLSELLVVFRELTLP